jgi:hypothetical protein
MPSIFDVFRQGDPAADAGSLSVDDLMGGELENPVLQSPPEMMMGEEPMMPEDAIPSMDDGPDSAMLGNERFEMRDFLVERAKARQQRSLEYQEQARAANGLK